MLNRIRIFSIPTHIIVVVSAWASKIIMAISQLIMVKIITEHLGIEQYAIYAVLINLLGWYLLLDFGLGTSIQNYISEHRADAKDPAHYIAATVITSFAFLIISCIVLYFVSPYLGNLLLNRYKITGNYTKEDIFFVVSVISIISAIGSIVFKIWYGKLKGYLSNIVPGIAMLISLVGVWLVVSSSLSDKLLWSLVAYLSPVAVLSMYFLSKEINPRAFLSVFTEANIFKIILKRSVQYWLFAIMSTLVLQLDYILMSQYVNSEQIVIYNLTTKIFGICLTLYSALLLAIWPIITELNVKNEWVKITKTISKYIYLGIVFVAIFTVLFILFKDNILKVFSSKLDEDIPTSFLILVCVYFMIRVFTDTYAIVLQSIGQLKSLWIWVPLQAVVNIVTQFLLVQKYQIYGIIIGLIISFILTVTWALPFTIKKHVLLRKR